MPRDVKHIAQRFWPDALGIALAALYAWPSTAYRFGRDQALFYYLGREWLHGSVPYRDAFDLKPPGIYLTHAISIALLGKNQSAIRVFDVLAVLATGVVAVLAVRRSTPRLPGELGAGALLACGFYFSTFDYWDTAQAEIWQGLFLLGSYALIVRDDREFGFRERLAAGALLGIAGLYKFTAALPGLVIVGLLLLRCRAPGGTGRRWLLETAKSVGTFAFGVFVPWLMTALYFAATKALPAVLDMLELLLNYAKNDLAANSDEIVSHFWLSHTGWWLALFMCAWVVAAGAFAARRDLSSLAGAVSALALFGASLLSVYAQKKFFSYHWAIVTGPFVLLPLYALRELTSLPAWLRLVPALGALLGGFFAAPPWLNNPHMNYRTFVTKVWPARKERPETMNRTFTGIANYNYSAQVEIAKAIKERQRPGDMLHVRGFELAMYALTGLRTPARFVSEVLFDDLRWATHPEKWSREQEERLWSARPRFIVTFVDRPWDQQKIAGEGYHEVTRSGLFALFERN